MTAYTSQTPSAGTRPAVAPAEDQQVIIIADDLAGAADCGVAFASRGLRTHAVLHAEAMPTGEWRVLALDTDTRAAAAEPARQRVARAAAGVGHGRMAFKKVDSTLRGHLAPELAGLLEGRPAELVLAVPAFPATGRTTRGGRQLLDGRPLEETEFAAQVSSSTVRELLAPCGLPISELSLEAVRGPELGELVARAEGILICDAVSEEDLGAVAGTGLQSGREIAWWGSAGLARALAALLAPASCPSAPAAPAVPGASGPRLPVPGGPVLLVVGSPSRATQEQVGRLQRDADLVQVLVDDEAAARRVAEALRAGADCLLTVDADSSERDAGEASRRLAAIAAEADPDGVALVLTGGETARAVLAELSVDSMELVAELQPGVSLGVVESPRRLAVALKAGGFGKPETLAECRRALRGSEREVERAWISR